MPSLVCSFCFSCQTAHCSWGGRGSLWHYGWRDSFHLTQAVRPIAHRNTPADLISFQWLLTGLIRQPFSVSLKTFQCQQTMRLLQCLFFITDGATWSCAISSSSPKNWNRERPDPPDLQPDINIYIYIRIKRRRKKHQTCCFWNLLCPFLIVASGAQFTRTSCSGLVLFWILTMGLG